MKLDITAKHLRVANLLKFTNGQNCNFLESCLGISRPNLNNYLKEIHNVIPGNIKTGKMDSIVKRILEEEDICNLLVSKQTVSKEDRTFFLILKLLITSTLNLDSLTEMLGVSRRTLNGDLLEIKESLNIFDLKIQSISGRGIFLDGEFLNIKRALCCYLYKFLVEEQYLPKIFYENFSEIIHCSEIERKLEEDIEKLISEFNLDTFFYNRALLKSFYLSFLYFDCPNSGDKSTLEHTLKKPFDFETYFCKVFTEEELPQFYNYLHNSVFRNLYFEEIAGFINILKICSGNFPDEKIYLNDHIK
ncbi:MAG: HTH domain-containing protein, partial [Cetobacterium sp.]